MFYQNASFFFAKKAGICALELELYCDNCNILQMPKESGYRKGTGTFGASAK